MKVGTRRSSLAVRQTELVIGLLTERFPDINFVLETLQTEGDRVRDRPVGQFGDKGVFVRAIEQALQRGRIDVAVHSLKDVPSDTETPGLSLSAFPPREDPRDVLVSRSGEVLRELPKGARIGTSSLRRQVQLAAVGPDLNVLDIRGNVDTRLRELDEGKYEAVVLAAAGIHRLGLIDRISEYLEVQQFVPDAGQGILVVQTREGDEVERLALEVDEQSSRTAAVAERAVVRALGADCRSPVGAYAEVRGNAVHLRGMAASEDRSALRFADVRGRAGRARELGEELGRTLARAISN